MNASPSATWISGKGWAFQKSRVKHSVASETRWLMGSVAGGTFMKDTCL